MKKGIVLLLLLSCLSTTSCSCSCYHHGSSKSQITPTNNESNKTIQTLKYNDLKKIVAQPKRDTNYAQKLLTFQGDYTDIEPIPCLGSTLYFGLSESTNEYTLKSITESSFNFDVGKIKVDENGLTSTVLDNLHGVYYSEEFPFIVYSYKVRNDFYQIFYRDCYGNWIYDEEIESTKITHIDRFNFNENVYFSLTFSNGAKRSFCYYEEENYTNSGEIYRVNIISNDEYLYIEQGKYSNRLSENYYDRRGNRIAIVEYTSDYLYIFDENYSRLNEVRLPAGFNKKFNLDTKLYIFGNNYDVLGEIIDNNYLEIDLLTGKEKYVNNFKYVIDTCEVHTGENGSFEYTYVTYYKISLGRINRDVKYCTILVDNFDLDNQFIYDGFLGEFLDIGDGVLLAKYENGVCLIKSNDEKIDLDCSDCFFVWDDYAGDDHVNSLYLLRKNGKYNFVVFDTLLRIAAGGEKLDSLDIEYYDYVSEHTIFNNRYFLKNYSDEVYYALNIYAQPMKYKQMFIDDGFIVLNDEIINVYQATLYKTNYYEIDDVKRVYSVGNANYYEIKENNPSNDTKNYLIVYTYPYEN